MELFEKINRSFGSWYEGLFGGSEDVRPKDILRRIFVAMEENRKEHLDDKIYVPNHYTLEISVDDEEEKEYLRSFLVREELETAIRRYCKQNHYEVRGGLEFTIVEVQVEADERRREKVRVKARYDSKLVATPAVQQSAPLPRAIVDEENATVYDAGRVDDDSEPGTVPAVAYAKITITPPGKPAFDYTLARGAITIGRSPKAGNDIVVDDEKMSRRHVRLEMEPDGRFTVYDLDTTNGTRVNGRRVDNATLKSGDEIGIGETRILFKSTGDDRARPSDNGRRVSARFEDAGQGPLAPRLVLMDGDEDVEAFVLASETLIGRAATNDIVLNDRSVATRHAAIKREDVLGSTAPHTLEVLDADHISLHNGAQLRPGQDVTLAHGDRVGLGTVTLRFEERRV